MSGSDAYRAGVESGMEKAALSDKTVGSAAAERAHQAFQREGMKPGKMSPKHERVGLKDPKFRKYVKRIDKGGDKGVKEHLMRRLESKGYSGF